jgi:thioredoxin reductase (NADPH)
MTTQLLYSLPLSKSEFFIYNLRYSVVGLAEEKAIEMYGADRIQVYHSRYIPLEESLNSRDHPEDHDSLKVKAYVKIVCDKQQDEKVIGIHYVGPNAGEVMQGYTVAIKLGVRKEDLDRTIGIHPTTAEEFVLLKKTKAEDPDKTSC